MGVCGAQFLDPGFELSGRARPRRSACNPEQKPPPRNGWSPYRIAVAVIHGYYNENTVLLHGLHPKCSANALALCTISRNGPARFRVNGPTLHGLPVEPRFESSTRPFSLRQVFWL